MRRKPVLLASACLLFLAARARADCRVSVDERGQLDAACLPALSADGARVAVPQRCGHGGAPCLEIVVLSARGKELERIELGGGAKLDAPLARANRLLARGKFARVAPLDVPFSARDLNLMHLRAGDVVLHWGDATLLVERDGFRIASATFPRIRICGDPWIRALFLDEKTRTLLIEYEYHDTARCTAPPPLWRVLRFP